MLGLGLGSAVVSSYGCSFFINTIHIQVTYRITFIMYKSRGLGQLAVVAYWVVRWTVNTKVLGTRSKGFAIFFSTYNSF